MSDKKDRNQKRMRDKYKKKNTSAEIEKKEKLRAAVEKERCKVPSNWDRYEEKECALPITETEAAHFGTLSSNLNESNFFQFKHEKKWLDEIKQSSSEQNQTDSCFNLDINLVKNAIGVSPLSIRCNIPVQIFTPEETEELDEECDSYHTLYQAICKQYREGASQRTIFKPQGIPNLSSLSISDSKSLATSKPTTLVDSVATSERAVPIKRSKPNPSGGQMSDSVINNPNYDLPNRLQPGTSNKGHDSNVNNVYSDKLELESNSIKTNKIDVRDSDDSDDDDLDFLLKLPTKPGPEGLKVVNSEPNVSGAYVSKPIVDTTIADDVDMDMLDSLLS